jgi:phosphohistidine phosphatase
VAEQLWLLRHGEAEPHGAKDDDDRRLTERGRSQARAAGRALASLEIVFHHVFTSPKVRSADTAALACEALGCAPMVEQSLREGFGVDDLVPLLHAAGSDKRVLLVGHEPDLSQLVFDLTGGRVDMKKGGLAGIRLENNARRGELIALLRPRELDRLGAV